MYATFTTNDNKKTKTIKRPKNEGEKNMAWRLQKVIESNRNLSLKEQLAFKLNVLFVFK